MSQVSDFKLLKFNSECLNSFRHVSIETPFLKKKCFSWIHPKVWLYIALKPKYYYTAWLFYFEIFYCSPLNDRHLSRKCFVLFGIHSQILKFFWYSKTQLKDFLDKSGSFVAKLIEKFHGSKNSAMKLSVSNNWKKKQFENWNYEIFT